MPKLDEILQNIGRKYLNEEQRAKENQANSRAATCLLGAAILCIVSYLIKIPSIFLLLLCIGLYCVCFYGISSESIRRARFKFKI